MDDRMIAGVRWSIDWLHKRAAGMNDPKAQDILNSAATNLGWDLRGHRPPPARSMEMSERLSEEAVEAAAKALFAVEYNNVPGWEWEQESEDAKCYWFTSARAALEAALPLLVAGEREWQPISTYPNCETCGEDACDWGPTVTVRVPTPWGKPVPMTAHLEAGMWLVRDSDDLGCWGGLVKVEPTHWAPIPAIRADKGGE